MTASVMPMVPPAPGLFSITKFHLCCSVSLLVTKRAMMSVPPAGGKGTIMRIGLLG